MALACRDIRPAATSPCGACILISVWRRWTRGIAREGLTQPVSFVLFCHASRSLRLVLSRVSWHDFFFRIGLFNSTPTGRALLTAIFVHLGTERLEHPAFVHARSNRAYPMASTAPHSCSNGIRSRSYLICAPPTLILMACSHVVCNRGSRCVFLFFWFLPSSYRCITLHA